MLAFASFSMTLMSFGPLLTILAIVLLLQVALQQPLSRAEHSALMTLYQRAGGPSSGFPFIFFAHAFGQQDAQLQIVLDLLQMPHVHFLHASDAQMALLRRCELFPFFFFLHSRQNA